MHRLHNPDFGVLLMRVAIGLVFLTHGWQKVGNMEQTIGFFGSIGIPAFLTYIVAYGEVIGGLLLIVGFFTRYAGIFLAVLMVYAVFFVHFKNGYSLANGGYEYALTLLLGALALAMTGSGKYSVAKHAPLCKECEVGAPDPTV